MQHPAFNGRSSPLITVSAFDRHGYAYVSSHTCVRVPFRGLLPTYLDQLLIGYVMHDSPRIVWETPSLNQVLGDIDALGFGSEGQVIQIEGEVYISTPLSPDCVVQNKQPRKSQANHFDKSFKS
jgi:hypothetical protein